MRRWYLLGFAAGLAVVGGWFLLRSLAGGFSTVTDTAVRFSEGEMKDTAVRPPAAPAGPVAPPPAAVAPPAAPAPPSASPEPFTLSTEIMLEFGGDGAPFTPGQPADITVLMEYSGDGPVTALGLMQDLPPGWAYEDVVGGDRPVVAPEPGTRGAVTFAWIQPPAFPFSFTFRAVPDAAAAAPAPLRAQAVFRKTGGELRSAPAETVMQPAPTADPTAN